MSSQVRLGSADLRAVFIAAGELGDCASARLDVLGLLHAVRRLVPCLAVCWSRLQFDPAHPNSRVQLDYACTVMEDPSLDEAFEAHYAEHPICCRRDLPPVVSISDVLTPLQWHRTGYYRDCFRPSGFEHEVRVELSHPAMQTHVVLLDREPGRGFDDRDKLVLRLLRPHLDAAFRRFVAAPVLTPKEREILRLVREGNSNREIAAELHISPATVRTHLANVFTRLGVHSRTAAVAVAGDLV